MSGDRGRERYWKRVSFIIMSKNPRQLRKQKADAKKDQSKAVHQITVGLVGQLRTLNDEVVKFTIPEHPPQNDLANMLNDGAPQSRYKHSEMLTAAKLIDKDSVKLAVAFLEPPVSYDACGPLSEKFLNSVLQLVSRYFLCDYETVGKEHSRIIRSGVFSLLRASLQFAESLEATKGKAVQSKSGWVGAGEVDEASKNFQNLPTTNREAVCGSLDVTKSLLEDGATELQQEADDIKGNMIDDNDNESDGGGDGGGEDEDEDEEPNNGLAEYIDCVPNILGLMKVGMNVSKKLKNLLKSARPKDLDGVLGLEDQIAGCALKLQALSDDFVVATYEDVGEESWVDLLNDLRKQCEDMLGFAKVWALKCGVDEPAWISLLERASKHNADKIISTMATVQNKLSGAQDAGDS